MDKGVAAQRTSLENELYQALRAGRSHEVHRLTQLLGGRGIGVHKRLFFHPRGSRPDVEDMKAHVKMTGSTRRRGRKCGGHQKHGKRCLGGLATSRLEPLDPNMVTKAREILFRTTRELARRNRRREALRACPDMFLAIVQIGGAETAGRHQCRRNDDVNKEHSQVRNARWSRPGTRNEHSTHPAVCTTQNGTLIDKRT